MFTRLYRPPAASYFLFGPRGTGKSTWLRARYAEALWIDLNDPENTRFYGAAPERLRAAVAANPARRPIVIDEVQRVPELLPVVHQLIELDKSLVFVDADDPHDTLRTYAALYVREEVQAEGLVRNVGGFSRFLEAVSFSHGAVLNASNVARECQVERKVVTGYLGVLQDLLLAFTLPVFTRRARRRMSVHPKFYLVDAGLFRSLRPVGPLDRPEELAGPALEGLVAAHLRAWIAYANTRDTLSYWRTRNGSEVDFVLYGESGLYALEVKNGATLHPGDLTGLRSFVRDYPEATPILLYRGRRVLEHDILCLPCDAFLRSLIARSSFAAVLDSA